MTARADDIRNRLSGFDAAVGPAGPKPQVIELTRMSPSREFEPVTIACRLDQAGFVVSTPHGIELASMTWERFREQLTMTMVGGFHLGENVFVDMESLNTLTTLYGAYRPGEW